MVPTMMAQAGAVSDLVDLPLYVLTAPVDAQPGWLGDHRGPATEKGDDWTAVAGQSCPGDADQPNGMHPTPVEEYSKVVRGPERLARAAGPRRRSGRRRRCAR
jgi:hypothetical protein